MHLLCEPNTFTSLVFIMHLLYEPNTCKNLVYHASAVQALYMFNPCLSRICCTSLIRLQAWFIMHLLCEPNTCKNLVFIMHLLCEPNMCINLVYHAISVQA